MEKEKEKHLPGPKWLQAPAQPGLAQPLPRVVVLFRTGATAPSRGRAPAARASPGPLHSAPPLPLVVGVKPLSPCSLWTPSAILPLSPLLSSASHPRAMDASSG